MTKYRVFWKDGSASIIPAESDTRIKDGVAALTGQAVVDVVDRIEQADTDREVAL